MPLNKSLQLLRLLVLTTALTWRWEAFCGGTWYALSNQAPDYVDQMLLLSDGTVMAHDVDYSSEAWFLLTPDVTGSYVNGTWSKLEPMHDWRVDFASAVLPDGRVFVAGGEYGSARRGGEVYDPINDIWTRTPDTGQAIMDAESRLLPDGRVLVAPASPSPSTATLIYDPTLNYWSPGGMLLSPGPGGERSSQEEASWVKLPDDSILTIDLKSRNAERYIPSLDQWIDDGLVPTQVWQATAGEIGPAVLLPDGRAFFIGGTSSTAFYTPSGSTNRGTWTAGPAMPNGLGVTDGPAAVMVNGKVLIAASPSQPAYSSPTTFLEYDPAANLFTKVPTPEGPTWNAPGWWWKMLCLPDGSILIVDEDTQLYIYQPDGVRLQAGKPTIISVTQNLDGSYHLTGTLLNGISEGAAYGDDAQMGSDYPIVRMTDGSNRVFYARTYNWSSASLRTGTNVLSTEFTLPKGLLAGTCSLEVVANGNASDPVTLNVPNTLLPAVKGISIAQIGVTNLTVRWNRIGGNETGYRIESSTDGTNFSVITQTGPATSAFADFNVTPMTEYYYRIIATNLVGDGAIGKVALATTSPTTSELPAGWLSQDIGLVNAAGAAKESAGIFTLIGSGRGIGESIDQFHWVYLSNRLDVIVTARILSLEAANGLARAGVMIRGTLADERDANALMAVGGDHNPYFQARETFIGGTVIAQGATNVAFPYWVRLARIGNVARGYTSTDGANWVLVGTSTAAILPGQAVLPPAVQADIGLAVASGDDHRLVRGVFDNVSVMAGPEVSLNLQGESPLTNECHVAFQDPGVGLHAPPFAIAAGGSNNVVLKADHTAAAWGDGSRGQTAVPQSATNLQQVALGWHHALGVRTDGTLVGWGDNTYHQATPPSGGSFVAAAAGKYHSLALDTNWNVIQWGNTSALGSVPSDLAGNTIAIASGQFHNIALTANNSIEIWGDNTYGQANWPSRTYGGTVAIAAGAYFNLALEDDGNVDAWGDNRLGQCNVPASATNGIAIAAGFSHGLLLRADRTVVVWGDNTYGQSTVPAGLSNVVAIAAGLYHSLALQADGTVVAWGQNNVGQTNVPQGLDSVSFPFEVSGTVDTHSPGTYTLTYSVTNHAVSFESVTRQVIVADTTPPVLSLLGANPLSILKGAPFIDPGAVALDACDGLLTQSVAVSGSVDTSVAGTNTLIYSVRDASGNTATNTRQVVVVSSIPQPVITPFRASPSDPMRVQFPGVMNANYSVLATTNLGLPFPDWMSLGTAPMSSNGVYRFTDFESTNYPVRFYRVRSPLVP